MDTDYASGAGMGPAAIRPVDNVMTWESSPVNYGDVF